MGIFDERHVEFLRHVQQGNIKLWSTPWTLPLYVFADKRGKDCPKPDQKIAAQVKALGLTHVGPKNFIILTDAGCEALSEEDNAMEGME